MPASKHLGRALFAALLALTGAGCSSDTVNVRIESTEKTNGGLPFYVVFRTVEGAAFVTESYDAVAKKVFANPKDQSVLRAEVVYPGVEREIAVEKPVALPLGVYFLFTKPGERWKTQRSLPVPSSMDIELDGNEIKRE